MVALLVITGVSQLFFQDVVAQSATPQSEANEAWTPVDCAEFQVNEAVAPVAECGYVSVPENRSNPDTNMIQLAVVRVKSPSATGSPVFVGTGGPGGPGMQMVTVPAQFYDITTIHAPLIADHEFVYFSQRGTELAKPFLTCPEYHAVASGFQTGLNGWTTEERDEQLSATLTACTDQFIADGVDLSGYNSVESADDVDDIRQILGFDKIIFYGQSYGTLLAQFLMRQHPETLESVVLDGVVPAEFPTYAKHNDVEASFQRMFDACAADADCAAAYPDLLGTLTQVVNDFNASPVPVQTTLPDGTDVTVAINGDAVLDYLFSRMVIGPPDNAEVPNTIYLLALDPTSLLPALVPSATTTEAELMQFTVNCSDDPSVAIEEFDVPGQPEAYQDFVYTDGIRFVIACNLLALPQLPDSSDAPVTNDIPVLILNGSLDPATPASSGDLVESYLPQVQSVTFEGGGHVQWLDACAVGVMASFLADPSTPVDTSCAPEEPTLAAPFTATFTREDGAASISLKLPAGFEEVGPGQWQNSTGLIIALAALPAGTDPGDAIVEGLAPLTPVDPALIVDGDPLAGTPTKSVTLDVDFNGTPFAVDAWAFATDTATYRVVILGQPPTGDQLRGQYPELLATLTITP